MIALATESPQRSELPTLTERHPISIEAVARVVQALARAKREIGLIWPLSAVDDDGRAFVARASAMVDAILDEGRAATVVRLWAKTLISNGATTRTT